MESGEAVGNWLQLIGPERAVRLFGVTLVGVNAENGKKLLFTVVFVVLVVLLAWLAKTLASWILALFGRRERVRFWTRQGIQLLTTVVTIVGLLSIWFSDPSKLATALGLVTAGLAFALQKVVTAVAGYFVLLRGETFNVGDRITMGGVRGDVMDLGLIYTTIMEMGQSPGEQADSPSMWIAGRQYTGRVVTVTNDKIFEEPVYNYSREFPYIWDEMRIPIPYAADHPRAEKIILEVTSRHTVKITEMSRESLNELKRRYFIQDAELQPRVYYRLTDNWIELSVRFIAKTHGIRELKNQMSRELLDELTKACIGIASGTYEVVGMPPLRVHLEDPAGSKSTG